MLKGSFQVFDPFLLNQSKKMKSLDCMYTRFHNSLLSECVANINYA